jgi:hypothetical protein
MLLVEFVIKRNADGSPIRAVSIVDNPAIEVDFIKLSKQDEIKFVANTDQMVVTGPALIPFKRVYRNAETMARTTDINQEAMIYFSAETIRELAEMFLANELNNSVTVDHAVPTTALKLRESWIIEDPQYDKSKSLGFDLPAGTWMLSYKVNDQKLWDQIKSGDLNGFSIEAMSTEFENIIKGTTKLSHEHRDPDQILPKELHGQVIERMRQIGETEQSLKDAGYEMVADEQSISNLEQALRQIGIELEIDADPQARSAYDSAFYKVRYKYVGPRDDKNREFCAQVLDLDLLYRREDIELMTLTTANTEFGNYNIFEYKGSFNCRHKWQRVLFQQTVATTGNQLIPGYKKTDSIPDGFMPIGDQPATEKNQPTQRRPQTNIGFSEIDFSKEVIRILLEVNNLDQSLLNEL